MMAKEKDEKNTANGETESTHNYSTISLPKPLVEKIKKRCEGTGFNSVSSYVTYVLRQLISNMEQKEPANPRPANPENRTPAKEAFSKDDEEKVKERLKALGYIQ